MNEKSGRSYPDYMNRYKNLGRSIGEPFTDPIHNVTLPYGTEIVDPVTGRKFSFGFMITQDARTTQAYARAVEYTKYSNGKPLDYKPPQLPPIERPSYGQQQPPTRFLPVERPDFSQPPMGGGSTRNVQWEGPGNPSWERRMRERAMGGMK